MTQVPPLDIDNIDPHAVGLRMFISEIAVDALDYLWDINAHEQWPRTIRDIHSAIGNKHEVSRTVINNLMKNMKDKGYVRVEEKEGQGGLRRRYWPVYENTKLMFEAMVMLTISLINNSLKEAEMEFHYIVKEE